MSEVRTVTTAADLLTIDEVIAILRVPRSTFYYWRQRRRGPVSIKLPNGDVRISRSEFEQWLVSHQEVWT
ncbi:helix-turn-helix transcriptional regulator [Longispora albida]|uniref:helix-turn-helix transcriptional regulator n=1 Tax=Longispora albida TaxID=203523 RepID=UPI0003A71E6D|nr:helix-turn-helix domain-containing protein [Longispora albida]